MVCTLQLIAELEELCPELKQAAPEKPSANPWKEYKTDDGRTYYYNVLTRLVANQFQSEKINNTATEKPSGKIQMHQQQQRRQHQHQLHHQALRSLPLHHLLLQRRAAAG